MSFKRSFLQQLLRLRFHLFQKHRFDRLVLETAAKRPFLILPNVFNPTLFLTSEFMVQTFDAQLIPPGSTVLDMGTGSGIGAIFAAPWAERVIAADINPAAVRCATINVLLNEVEELVEVRHSDLFAAVAEKFDVILFNPPYFPGEPTSMLDRALHAGDVIERFAAELEEHLKPNGRLLLLLSEDAPIEDILVLFRERGFGETAVAQQTVNGEIITLFQLIQ